MLTNVNIAQVDCWSGQCGNDEKGTLKIAPKMTTTYRTRGIATFENNLNSATTEHSGLVATFKKRPQIGIKRQQILWFVYAVKCFRLV